MSPRERASEGPQSDDHFAIGDVLQELRSEFDDITISKIRFLESQGLIAPERTPSGYRKFAPEDVERLRWILAQQRDHFLPLKVIKDRLDELDESQLSLDDLDEVRRPGQEGGGGEVLRSGALERRRRPRERAHHPRQRRSTARQV